MKWWKKFFFWGVEIAISNAYIINNEFNPKTKKGNENFKRFLIEQLLDDINIDNIQFENGKYHKNI